MNIPDMFDMLDGPVKDVFRRMSGFTVENMVEAAMQGCDLWSLAVTTQGDYTMTILLCTVREVLLAITRGMKRGAVVKEEDVPIYTEEFFNVLCGHIVSRINNKNHLKARFGIPKLWKGACIYGIDQEAEGRQEYYYRCEYGAIKLEIVPGIQKTASVERL